MRNASTNAGHRPQGDGAVPQPAYRPSIAMCRADAVGDGVYALTSSWQGNVNGKLVIVHVGALRGDARRGAIIVTEMPADLDRRCGRHFEGPAGCGSLRIIDSSEDRLLISCANGKTYWFAIPTPDSRDRPAAKAQIARLEAARDDSPEYRRHAESAAVFIYARVLRGAYSRRRKRRPRRR